MNYEIIPIREDHIESYCKAVGEVARERKYIARIEAPSLEQAKTLILENIQHDYPCFVVLIDGEVIGWCFILVNLRPAYRHVGSMMMGIISKYRGNGIGQTLLRLSLEKAKFIGLKRVYLEVIEDNEPAICLYKKFGFEVEGIKRKAIHIDDKYKNLISMGLLF